MPTFLKETVWASCAELATPPWAEQLQSGGCWPVETFGDEKA